MISDEQKNRRDLVPRKHLHLVIRVELSMLLHRSPHLRYENLALLIVPAHDLCQKIEREPLGRLAAEEIYVVADLFQLGVLAPRSDGDPEPALHAVDEAGLLHVFNHPVADADFEGLAQFLARFLEDFVPLVEDVIFLHDVRVAPNVEFLVLEVAAGLQVAVGLLVEGWPVADGAVEIACVDIVKVVIWPRPLQLGVVDLELAVRGNPGGLDGGYVGADYLGLRVLVGEVSDTYSQSARSWIGGS